MVSILNFAGFVLFLGALISGALSLVEWSRPIWGVAALGFALAAIPAGYKIGVFRALVWVALLYSIYMIGNPESKLSEFLALIVFFVIAWVAGLEFEAGDVD